MTQKVNRLYLTLTGIGGLVGIALLVYRLQTGLKVSALTTPIPWGMWVSFYIYFIGLSAGSFLFSTLIYVFGQKDLEKAGRIALVSAVLALIAGIFFIWIDLGHPERVFYVFTHWNHTSVLAWEILFYNFYIACIFAELWFLMRCDLAHLRDTTSGWKKKLYGLLALGWQCPKTKEGFLACHNQSLKITAILGAIGVPLAIGVHGGTGAIFAVVKARPYWYSPLFPIIFLVSALVSGAGLMTCLYAVFGKRDRSYPTIVQRLATWLIIFLSIDILLIIAELLVGLYGGIPDHLEVWKAIMFGDYWYVFWLGQIGLAMVVPILIYIYKRDSVAALGVAGFCVVVGIVAVRFNLVIPAFIAAPIPGLEHAYQESRFLFHYFPSLVEWALSFGIISLVAFLFGLAFEVLPMYDIYGETLETSKEVVS